MCKNTWCYSWLGSLVFIHWPWIGESIRNPNYSAAFLCGMLISASNRLGCFFFCSKLSCCYLFFYFFLAHMLIFLDSMCFSFAFVGWDEEKGKFWLWLFMKYHFAGSTGPCFEHCYVSSMFVWILTSNVLFFSVLADFNQVKPAWSERIKPNTDLASFAPWWNTEKYSSLWS